MNKIFLITGANIGDRKKNLETAAAFIKERIGKIIKSSSIYETEAWGNNDQPAFYNQVFFLESDFSAEQTMEEILKIEKEMGRVRTTKNAARIIDIDILFFNDEIINSPNLIVPHKEISNRRFVLMPLNELAPTHIHPVLKKNMEELLSSCKDPLKVTRLKS
jgi:2-amino-4-hydroxy-6-hydroxymethyldihydropteridine diphosphokinase